MATWQFWTLIGTLGALSYQLFILKKKLEYQYVVTAQVLAEIHKGNRDRRDEWRQSLPDTSTSED